jgi:hypothetical protein
MRRLRDDERGPDPHDACGLAQDDLDAAGILVVTGDLSRFFGRLDAGERDNSAFGLRHDLLREHDHVAVLELELRRDELGQVVPLLDLGQAGDRDDAKLAAQGRPVRRIPACAL